MYQRAEVSLVDDQPGFPLTFLSLEGPPQKAFGLEAQYLFRSRYVNVVAGGGYFDVDSELETTLMFDPEIFPPPDDVFQSTQSTALKHTNLYAYSHIKPNEQLTLIAGASADLLDGDAPDVGKQDQFNPKFGIIWKPTGGTTVRGAAFKAVKRTLITDQTSSPPKSPASTSSTTTSTGHGYGTTGAPSTRSSRSACSAAGSSRSGTSTSRP
jgi:outer membrane receptor protein involved in Fe transport